MSHEINHTTRRIIHRSNNAQLKRMQHTGIYKPVRTLSYGIRVSRRKRR